MQEPARILAADDELTFIDMDDKKHEKLTLEMFGEMYVNWRLEEGLFADDTLGIVRLL